AARAREDGTAAAARRHVARAEPGRAQRTDHVVILSGLPDHLMGRAMRAGRSAASDGREGVGPVQAGAGERRAEDGVLWPGSHVVLEERERHGSLPPRRGKAARADHQGVGCTSRLSKNFPTNVYSPPTVKMRR